jgi:hypothetical protein
MTASPLTKLTAQQRARILIALGVKKAPGIKPYLPTRPAKPARSSTKQRAPTNRAIPIRCITTGEIFPSITAAAHAHKVHPPHLSDHLKGRGHSVGGRTYEYYEYSPGQDTPRHTPRHTTAPRAVRCIDDGQEFRSLTACAKHYNIAPANLKLHLDGLYRGLNNHRFEWVKPDKAQ